MSKRTTVLMTVAVVALLALVVFATSVLAKAPAARDRSQAVPTQKAPVAGGMIMSSPAPAPRRRRP